MIREENSQDLPFDPIRGWGPPPQPALRIEVEVGDRRITLEIHSNTDALDATLRAFVDLVADWTPR